MPALDTRRLIDDPAIDAVAICAPTDAHVGLIAAVAEAGKAVFCEKPISLDLAEVDRALLVVARTGAQLMVGFNRRFDASHAAVRDAVAGGAIGPPHLVRITSRDPAPPPLAYARTSGGIFLDMTIHDFDMARYVVGSEVVEVYAAGRGPGRSGAGGARRCGHRCRHPQARERVPHGDRQQPAGELRLRPEGGGAGRRRRWPLRRTPWSIPSLCVTPPGPG